MYSNNVFYQTRFTLNGATYMPLTLSSERHKRSNELIRQTYLQANVIFSRKYKKTSLWYGLITFAFQRILYFITLGLLPSTRYVKICWITIICHQCGECCTPTLPLREGQSEMPIKNDCLVTKRNSYVISVSLFFLFIYLCRVCMCVCVLSR